LIGQHSTVAYPFLPDPAALQASRLKVFSRSFSNTHSTHPARWGRQIDVCDHVKVLLQSKFCLKENGR